jgi:Mn-dependent DtxR family transcriptional regulator
VCYSCDGEPHTGTAEKNQAGEHGALPGHFLTEAGHKLAEECKQRHETVTAFLRSLGISEKVAEMDAEGIDIMLARKLWRRSSDC